MKKHFFKVKKYCGKHGILKTIKRCFERVGFFICFRRVLIFKLDLLKLKPSIVCSINFIFEELNISKICSINANEYFDGWFDKEVAIIRLKKGHRLFVARKDKIINYAWVESGSISVPCLDLNFLLSRKTACFAYSYTIPSFRGKGVSKTVKNMVSSLLCDQKYSQVIAFMDVNNHASISVHKKNGSREVMLFVYLRLFFIKIYLCKGLENRKNKIFVLFGRNGNKVINNFLEL